MARFTLATEAFRARSAFSIMEAKLLIVDDDRKLQELLREYLSGLGFEIAAHFDGGPGVEEAVRTHRPDLLILDVMLPRRDGLEILRDLRKDFRALPVIMLTARGDDSDRIVGLELGADDYLPKPFNPRELLARIRAVMRRFKEPGGADAAEVPEPAKNGEPLRCGRIVLDPRRFVVTVGDQELELSSVELRLLELFLKHVGETLSRDEIMNHLHGRDYMGFERSIDVHVSRIRAHLEQAGEPNRIRTVRGAGYRFVETDASGAGES